MEEKDSIEKIDEQIDSLLHPKEEVGEVSNSSEDDGDTKKIESVQDMKKIEESTYVEEDTKKILKVTELDNQKQEVSDINEHVNNDSNNSEEKKVEDSISSVDSNPKKKKKRNIKIIVFICISLLLVIFIVLIMMFHKKENISQGKKDILSKSEQKEIITDYGDDLQEILSLYYKRQKILLEYDDVIKLVDNDYTVKCLEHEIYDDGQLYLNQCSIKGEKTKYSYGEKQEKKEESKVSDKAVKVYVLKKNQKATLNEPKNKDDYDVYSVEIDGAYHDLELLDESLSPYIVYVDEEEIVHMIQFKTGRKVLDMLEYQNVLPIQVGTKYDPNYVAVKMNEKWGIYNINNNERIIPHQYDSVTSNLDSDATESSTSVISLESGVIAVRNSNGSSSSYGLVDYHSGKVLIPVEYSSMVKSGNYLYVKDIFGFGHLFNHYGEEFLADRFDDIYWIANGKYVLVLDGENTKLVSINGKEIYDYGKLNIGSVHYALDFKNRVIFEFDNNDAALEDSSKKCIDITYNFSKKAGEVEKVTCDLLTRVVPTAAKPVLYLYPKKTMDVKVTFEHPEYLLTTYPKFQKSWNVTAHKNGDLYDSRNHYYYGLYWDEVRVHSVDFSTGFYVEKENAIEFLEEKLDKIGFSPREANEFIMYWLPILEKNEKSLVYFELTEERESYQKIHITPKPDSLLRVLIHIKKVEKKTSILEEELTPFKREGFTAVEWGGTTY